jgi:hypothetical protein
MEQDRTAPVRSHHGELARDESLYQKGIKVSEEEMQAIRVTRDSFHGVGLHYIV